MHFVLLTFVVDENSLEEGWESFVIEINEIEGWERDGGKGFSYVQQLVERIYRWLRLIKKKTLI